MLELSDLPFAKTGFGSIQLNISRDEDRKTELLLAGRNIKGTYFKNKKRGFLVEEDLLGSSSSFIEPLRLEGKMTDRNVLGKFIEEKDKLRLEGGGKDEREIIMNLTMKDVREAKRVHISVDNLRGHFVLPIFQKFMRFFEMDESPDLQEIIKDFCK